MNYLIKNHSEILFEDKNCLTNIFNMAIIFALYLDKEKNLVPKLLKMCLKIINLARNSIQTSDKNVKSGAINGLIQNQLIKLVTSTIDFDTKDSDRGFNEMQILYLEIHLQLDDLRDKILTKYGILIPKVTVDTESISEIKKSRHILTEGENYGLLKYIFHLGQLDEEKIKLMNLNIESNNPAFDVMTRTHIDIPEVQRVKIIFKDSMKLKDMTFVGISNDPNSNITLKKLADKEFDWPSGNFYIFYPVQPQCVVGFGSNSSNKLGNNSNYKTPVIVEPA